MVFGIGIDATYVHSFCVYFLVCDNYKIVAGRFEVLYFRVSSLISSKNCNQTISSRWDWLFRRPTTIPQKKSSVLIDGSLLLTEPTFTASWSSSGLGRCSQMLHRFLSEPETHQVKNNSITNENIISSSENKTLAPVRTTLPDTNMSSTIRGFTILVIIINIRCR